MNYLSNIYGKDVNMIDKFTSLLMYKLLPLCGKCKNVLVPSSCAEEKSLWSETIRVGQMIKVDSQQLPVDAIDVVSQLIDAITMPWDDYQSVELYGIIRKRITRAEGWTV